MYKKYLFGIISLLFTSFLFCGQVSAASNELQISPSKSKIYNLSANATENGSFIVSNVGDNDFTFKVEILPYSVSDDRYTGDFETENSYNKIASWITASAEKYTLKPGESTSVNYKITVPKDIPSGGQYAAIAASITSSQGYSETSDISIIGRAGHIVYAHLTGETRKEAALIENSIPSFFISSKIHADSIIENTGNIDIDATYEFEVFDAFSGEIIYTNQKNNDTERRILPETKRYIVYSWDGSPQLGIFKVRQSIEIFGEPYVSEKLVFICPFWLIILLLLFIAAGTIWIISRINNRKRE